MITNTTADSTLFTQPKWPELPRLSPQVCARDPELREWDAALHQMWNQTRAGLDRLQGGGGGATVSYFAGGMYRPSSFNGSGGGRSGSGGGIVPRPNGSATYLTDLEGVRYYYTPDEPMDAREGDIWYDIDDFFRVYWFHNGKWVDVFANVPTLERQVLPALDPRAVLAEAQARHTRLVAEAEERSQQLIEEAEARRGDIIAEAERRIAGLRAEAATRDTVAYRELAERRRGDADATALIRQVESVLTAAQMAEAVRIATLEATVDTPGTGLRARIVEMESVMATDAEVSAAISQAIEAEVINRNAAINLSATATATAYTNADAVLNTALGGRLSELEATVNTPTSGLLARVVQVENVMVTEAEANAAISTAIATEATNRNAAITTSSDAVTLAFTNADSALNTALGGRLSQLEATVDTPATGLSARVVQVENVMATEAEVEASISTAIAAEVTNRNAAITTTANSLTSAYTNADALLNTALGGRLSDLEATVNTPTTGLTARVTQVETVMATEAEVAASISTALSAAAGDAQARVDIEATARATATGSLAAEYVLTVATGGTVGRRMTGFRITNLGGAVNQTEFVIETDKFTLVDSSGNSPRVPFTVFGGNVFIDKAVIREVAAGAILAGQINVALTLGVAGSLTVSSGANRFYTDESGTTLGDPNGLHFEFGAWDGLTNGHVALMLRNGAQSLGFWTADALGNATLDLAYTGKVQSVNMVTTQMIQVLKGTDPRDGGAPLYVNGGAYISGHLDVLTSVHAPAYYDNANRKILGAQQTAPVALVNNFTPTGTYANDASAIYSMIMALVNSFNAQRTILMAHGLEA